MPSAQQLATTKFVRIGSGHTTAEAVGIAFDPAASTLREIVIVVLDEEGSFLGIVEPRDILDRLGTELGKSGGDSDAQVAAIRRGLAIPVSELIRRDIAVIAPNDELPVLLAKIGHSDASYFPVLDGDHFIGVIPITAVFDAVCGITLGGKAGDIPFLNA